MIVPAYELPKNNIFDFRQKEWNETDIINTIQEMLACGEKYDIITKRISFSLSNKKKQDSEIKKTLSKCLKIELAIAGGTKIIELEYDVPWLQKNYFYIAGSRKIPIYQLFDRPLIVRGDTIKVRTNIQTIQMNYVNNRRGQYYYVVSIFNKKIPLVYFILALCGKEGLEKLTIPQGEVAGDRTRKLSEDALMLLTSDTLDESKIFSKFFRGKSDKDIIENVLLLTEIDIFSKRYMFTDNVITELVWAIKSEDKKVDEIGTIEKSWTNLLDDCSLENKRLRCIEYFLYHFISKDFYNMIISLKKTKRDNFNNNSKVILMNANVSPVVQYEAPINPLDELARLTRVALTGPGGFKKDNIPPYLRDIHPSMIGRMCPADTGDRENCGALQYLSPPLELDNSGIFNHIHPSSITSVSIAHVPFLEHDDPTRLQMASSQMRHAIMLKDFDSPICQTGLEGMYTDHTSFLFRAERDGKVIFKNKDIIIVQYNNNKCRAFNIGYKKSRLSIVDFYNTYFNSDEENRSLPSDQQLPVRFRKGDIIAESNFLKHGRLTIGRNLKTAVMTWYGYNFEDAIIVSQQVKEKMTSVHYLDLTFELGPDKVLLSLKDDASVYSPLPKVGDVLKKGDPYAIIKTLVSKQEGYNDIIFDAPTTKTVDEDCVITDVKIFVRKRNKILPVFDDYIMNLVKKQNQDKDELIAKLRYNLTKDELDQFLLELEIDETSKDEERFKLKGEAVDGILITITAIYERSLQVGDKIGNRHGNKGIISIVLPEEKMPRMPDGSHAEVVLNPLGIISRMNVGQLFELHMSQCVMDMKATIREKYQKGIEKKTPADDLESDIYDYIMGFIKIIDKTQDNNYTEQMKKRLEVVTLDHLMDFLEDFYIIQPPFESVKLEDLKLAMDYTGTKFEYPCFDPISKGYTKHDVAFGYMYLEKLNHISKDKCAVRGIGPYTTKTSQPLHGKVRKGGQRLGEMEVWSLIAHGARENLNEVLTTKSDSIKKRNKYISDMIQNNELLWDKEDDNVSQSLRLFQAYLTAAGIKYQIIEDEELMSIGSPHTTTVKREPIKKESKMVVMDPAQQAKEALERYTKQVSVQQLLELVKKEM